MHASMLNTPSIQGSSQIHQMMTLENDPEIIPLNRRIDSVTNSSENKIDNTILLLPGQRTDFTAKNSLLKKMLIGGSILMGAGVIAAVGISCYVFGRTDSLNKSLSPSPMGPSGEGKIFPSEINDMQINYPYAINKTDVSLSPYSYYEKKNAKSRDEALQLASSTTAAPTTSIRATTENTSSYKTSEKLTTTMASLATPYRHESMRNIYYDSLPADSYRPLGKQLRNQLAEYCNGEIQTVVYHASSAPPEKKCQFLAKAADDINIFKDDDIFLRGINSRKDILTVDEHAYEIITRRMLTTAYLAAECIIDGKSAGYFYDTAMKDHKLYSDAELAKREERIMNYFPEHHEEC